MSILWIVFVAIIVLALLGGAPTARSAAYKSIVEEMTYRWAVICQACFSTLDNYSGLAEVSGRLFNLAGASRGDRAATYDDAKYRKFQRREAEKLGIMLGDE